MLGVYRMLRFKVIYCLVQWKPAEVERIVSMTQCRRPLVARNRRFWLRLEVINRLVEWGNKRFTVHRWYYSGAYFKFVAGENNMLLFLRHEGRRINDKLVKWSVLLVFWSGFKFDEVRNTR